MTDSLCQSQVLPYIAGLIKFDYEFEIISLEKKEKFLIQGKEIQQFCNQHNIRWNPIIYTKKPPILNTIFDLYKMSKLAIKRNLAQGFDMIHCRGYLPTLIALPLKKKWKIPLIFDIRGFWINERVDGGIWNLKNPIFRIIYNYLKRKEIKLFREADCIISLTHKAIPIIRQIQGTTINNQFIQVIPTCVDTAHFTKEKVNHILVSELKQKLNINHTDFILSYLGSLSTWYKPDEMFDFFKCLLKFKPEAKFLIITQDNHEVFKERANKKGISDEKIIFTSALRNEVPSYLSLSDASIFFIKPAFSKAASSPTKLGELLSMEIPVICNSGIGDTGEIVNSSKTGCVCETFSIEAYNKAIEQYFNDPSLKKGFQLREKAIELFGLEMGVSKYLSAYKKMLHQE